MGGLGGAFQSVAMVARGALPMRISPPELAVVSPPARVAARPAASVDWVARVKTTVRPPATEVTAMPIYTNPRTALVAILAPAATRSAAEAASVAEARSWEEPAASAVVVAASTAMADSAVELGSMA